MKEEETRNLIMGQIEALEDRILRKILVLKDAVQEKDWHGVSDYANDIREIEQDIHAKKDFLALLERRTTITP